ncbi:replication protein A 70 kDa DNA-binding subunit [Culicoides brevitarsis]|uniref:replication protein A 70 kDa DNA-binding subunit n=1 Tax=Culicoides brevitarsis TaxID=469753 RepID=UPI00307CB383
MPISQLSEGSILQIYNGTDVKYPVLQVLGAKRIPPQTADAEERFRLLVSDGKYQHSFTMLATQLNHMFTNNLLTDYTIFRVDKYTTSHVGSGDRQKKVLVLLDITIMNSGDQVGKKIGDPVSVDQVAAPAGNTAASTTAAPKPKANVSKPQMDMPIGDGHCHPINSLSPYQNKWVIKARVTSKSNIRTWSNAKGEGKLFSMDLKDETGEIRATAFTNEVDKFYEMIEIGKVYYISKCQLKTANKQYSNLKNDYEMTFTHDTQVKLCEEDDSAIPSIEYNFVPIKSIANMEPNSNLDVIAVVKSATELAKFQSKSSGKELQKRELTLVDMSNSSIQLVLWGEQAENFDMYSQPVILVKSARVSEFGGGKTIGLGGNGLMILDPKNEEATKLREWFASGQAENIADSVSAKTSVGGNMSTQWMSFHEVKENNLGSGEKPDYFQCKAMVHNIRPNNAVYKACPTAECNKKLVDLENGSYRCEKCNAEYSNFQYRLLFNMLVGDWSSNRFVTVFTETGENMLNKASQEVGEAIDSGDTSILESVNFKSFIFKMRSKVETYGDSSRNKLTVVAANPVNYKEYNNYLITQLQEMTGIGKMVK